MLCLMTLADVGAVNPDVLTPWKEDLLWRLYVRRLQPSHARLRRRAAAEGSRRTLGRRRRASRRHHRGRADDVSQGPAAPLPDALRPGVDLPPRAPGARHSDGRSARVSRAARRRLGADGRHARQAVPLLEHLRRAVVLRHGHPPRTGDDDAGRPRARRVRVHGRRRLPPAERRCADRDLARCSRASSPAPSTCRRCSRGKLQSLLYRNRRHGVPVVHFDNEHSQKYTVLEIVADDAPGAAAIGSAA